jgi:hypothetical protein
MYRISTHPASNGGDGCPFYVLSRGRHAGRPSKTPFANSFEVRAGTAQEAERLYWIAFALWNSRRLQRFLKGSVIEFITIGDYRRLFAEAERAAPANAKALAEGMKGAQAMIENAQQKIRMCEQLKRLLASQFLTPKSSKDE